MSKQTVISNFFSVQKTTTFKEVALEGLSTDNFYEKCFAENLSECKKINCFQEKRDLDIKYSNLQSKFKEYDFCLNEAYRIAEKKAIRIAALKKNAWILNRIGNPHAKYWLKSQEMN